jgi:DNA-binding CsgD family transcriptional regulator
MAELLRQFLQHVNDQPESTSDLQVNTDAQVVLDVHVDGVRYTLTRSLPQLVPPRNLSPREKEIVRLVAKGHANKTIAEVLDMSPWTVSTHLRRIFTKLGVSSRAEMVARALQEGLLHGNK